MQRIGDEYTVIDPNGNAVPYATVAIYLYGTLNLATVYSATDVVTPTVSIANPFTTDALGRWRVAIPDGRYDITISGGSFPAYTIPKVCVFDSTVTYPSPMVGTVTSVALGAPAEFTVSGSPVTGVGTLTFGYGSWATSKLLIAPSGAPGTPTLRNLVMADLPTFGPTASTTFGSATQVAQATTDAYGRIVTLANVTVTPTWASVTAKPSSLGPSGFAVADGIVVVFRQTASVTIGNTASETTMIGAGAGSKNLAANQLVAGSTIRVKFAGTIGIAVAVTTVRLKLKLGANTIFDSGAQILISAIAGTVISPGATVTGEFAFTVRTAGAAGNGIGQVMMWVSCVQSNNYGGIVFPIVGNSATPTIDTVTGAQAIDATLQFGAANANTTITVSNLTIQVEG